MTRRLAPWFGPLCALALLLFCYRPVLFGGGQFGFRDSAHYYYPLYAKVQSEWQAGRVPLWDPSENAGMPLLGNPTAAVLYPGKLIFALFSYPWAVRWYAVMHSVLAFAGTWVLLRGWKASSTAATLAGLSFAGGAPVLFQYCNIIFLVGAAWIPWGFWAVDRWLRLGRPGSLLALAVVLAMQVLGGDPESAYVVGMCAGGYALLLARAQSRLAKPTREPLWTTRRWAVWSGGLVVGGLIWFGLSLLLARDLPGFRPLPGESTWGPVGRWLSTGRIPRFQGKMYEGPVPAVGFMEQLPRVVVLIWAGTGLIWIRRWRRSGSKQVPLVPMLAGLVAAATLAGALTAAQLLPVVEFAGISGRATGEGAHDIYPFSLEPYRLVEMVWPGFFGRTFGSNVAWMGSILPNLSHRTWVSSLYVGGLTLAFGFGALRGRQSGGEHAPWRSWLLGIAALGFAASFGEFGSPLWLARFVPGVAEQIGPHDQLDTNSVRLDGFLRDGDGSPYWLLATVLPGFQSFRFPSKLFSFVALALACLAGLGWDRVAQGEVRWVRRIAWSGFAVSLVSCIGVILLQAPLQAQFTAWKVVTLFGPMDSGDAVIDLIVAIGHGTLTWGAAVGLIILSQHRPRLAGQAAIAVMALDLGWANASIVRSVPQTDFEVMPQALARIAEAEKLDPADGPYRIHRVPIWNPAEYFTAKSPDRIRDFVTWEMGTIQPKYGLLHNVEYTKTIGFAELYDYEWFFPTFPRSVVPEAARYLRITPGDKIVITPRRGFDLWGSRYFIVPGVTRWDDANRGIAPFLPDTKPIYPDPSAFKGPGGAAAQEKWARSEDVQILRNRTAYPRAWVVHDARFKPPVVGLGRKARDETMQEILFGDDLFWRDATRTVYDPKRLAWIETVDPAALSEFLTRTPPNPLETVKVTEQTSDRTVLEATLEHAGLVILADVFYPGWTLTIDDKPAPIYRGNRLMRAAAVRAGKHRLVYQYQPTSFRVGLILSALALVVLGGCAARLIVTSRMRSARSPAPGEGLASKG